MTRERTISAAALARCATLGAIALAVPTHGNGAQGQVPGSVQDYRLPPSRPSAAPPPAPSVAGPVDSEHPTAAPTRQAAPPAPDPSPASNPAIILPSPSAPLERPAVPRRQDPPGSALPSPTRSADAGRPPPVLSPQPISPPAVSPNAAPALSPTLPDAPAASPAPPATETPPRSAATEVNRRPWDWIAGGLAALLLTFGMVLLRRRGKSDAAAHGPAPALALPQASRPDPEPAGALPPSATAQPEPPSPPQSAAPPESDPRMLELRFEARHLSRAMVNASLAYRLTLTNRGPGTVGPLRIAGDIISAHGSLSSRDQLAPPGEALATMHQVPAMAPDESITLNGELRLPLASILPIHSGGARVFVPLARFRIDTGGHADETHVFVVGQAGDRPGGALRPFPLDRGPGVDHQLDQRELGLPV